MRWQFTITEKLKKRKKLKSKINDVNELQFSVDILFELLSETFVSCIVARKVPNRHVIRMRQICKSYHISFTTRQPYFY